ncbi:MAG: DUF167 domain-containing protein [Promethearchaeota archaeon]
MQEISAHALTISFTLIKPENAIEPMRLRGTPQGTVIDIYMRPNSKHFRIQFEEDELVVHCREAPTKGKANRELIKELSRLFERRVQIVSGSTSRQKRILIESMTVEEVNDFFARKQE